jgi:hypothetical protein
MEVTAAGTEASESSVGDDGEDEGLAAKAAAAFPLTALVAALLRSWATSRPRTPGFRLAGAGAKVQARLRWAHWVQGCVALHFTFRTRQASQARETFRLALMRAAEKDSLARDRIWRRDCCTGAAP